MKVLKIALFSLPSRRPGRLPPRMPAPPPPRRPPGCGHRGHGQWRPHQPQSLRHLSQGRAAGQDRPRHADPAAEGRGAGQPGARRTGGAAGGEERHSQGCRRPRTSSNCTAHECHTAGLQRELREGEQAHRGGTEEGIRCAGGAACRTPNTTSSTSWWPTRMRPRTIIAKLGKGAKFEDLAKKNLHRQLPRTQGGDLGWTTARTAWSSPSPMPWWP